MAGRRCVPAATSSYLPPVMTALLFLWVFSCGHVEASIEFANMTALEKHVEFFDRNKDGVITASELFEGYIAIGCDAAFASSSAASISAGVGPITSPSNSNRQSADHRKKRRRARRKTARGEGARAGNTVREYGVFTDAKPREADAPLPHSTIYIEYIHNAMHGSDTGAYDGKGRFVPAKFEEIFTKHAKVRPDALTYEEIEEMILANRDPLDPSSWSAPEGEWGLIYKLASDKQGFLHKDSARGIYDGSVFYKLEEQRTSARSDM